MTRLFTRCVVVAGVGLLLGTAVAASASQSATRFTFVYSGSGLVQVVQHVDNRPGHGGSAYDDTYTKQVKWSISWKVTIDDGQIVKLSKPTGEVSGTASADQKSVPSKCSDEVELPVDAALRQYVPTEFEVVDTPKGVIRVRLRGFPVAWAAAPRCTAGEGAVSHVAVTYSPASVAWSKSWGQPEFTIAPFNNYKITPASVGNRFPFAPVGITTKVVFDWSGRLKIAKFGSPPAGPETTPEVVKDFASAQWNALVPLYQEAALALELSLKSEELRQVWEELQIAEALPLLPPDMRKFLMAPSFFYDWFFPAAFDFYTTAFKTLVLLEDAYNDPPLPNYAQVVRVARSGASLQLPSCASAPAGAKSFCARLRSAALAYSTSLQASKSLAQALATTVGRESGAAKAGDKKALARQQRAARALVPRLRVAFANHKAAGAKLAAVLRSGRFAPKLTTAQARRGIAILLRDLAAHGVLAKDVRSILGGKTLTPVPLDQLALLGGKRPANPPPPPPPAKATITAVTFTGSPKSPSIVVRGKNLGTRPAPNPAGSPSNQPLCPVKIQGNAGLNYGTSLYLEDTSQNWAAGRYRPSIGELDCIGLIVTKFTSSEVGFHFGGGYAQFYPKYTLVSGDAVRIAVNGALKTVRVKYGAP